MCTINDVFRLIYKWIVETRSSALFDWHSSSERGRHDEDFVTHLLAWSWFLLVLFSIHDDEVWTTRCDNWQILRKYLMTRFWWIIRDCYIVPLYQMTLVLLLNANWHHFSCDDISLRSLRSIRWTEDHDTNYRRQRTATCFLLFRS